MNEGMANIPDAVVLEFQPDTWEARWRRVAAWSAELARVQGTNAQLLAHPLIAIIDRPKGAEFLEDLGIEIASPGVPFPKLDPAIRELAFALDDHLAWEAFEEGQSQILPFEKVAFESLRCVSDSELNRALASLPVFPAAAQKALQLLSTETWNASDVQAIAASDQVLASSLIRVANSCSCGARKTITTLNHAIAYLGAQRASGVLIAASVKRLFAPPRLRQIWDHSIDASEVSRNLAKLSRHANPEEAFLAGLVHDIGRLAMALLPERFQTRSTHLSEQGCQLSLVEQVLCGATHAEIGASALERWKFPQNLVEAVRFHHRPEQTESPLAAVLYLMERSINPEETPPSLVRSKAALDRLRLSAGMEFSVDPGWRDNPLRFQS